MFRFAACFVYINRVLRICYWIFGDIKRIYVYHDRIHQIIRWIAQPHFTTGYVYPFERVRQEHWLCGRWEVRYMLRVGHVQILSPNQRAFRTRLRNKGNPARPNIIRLISLTLLTMPSTKPLFSTEPSPATTAALSRSRPRAKLFNSSIWLSLTLAIQLSRFWPSR